MLALNRAVYACSGAQAEELLQKVLGAEEERWADVLTTAAAEGASGAAFTKALQQRMEVRPGGAC